MRAQIVSTRQGLLWLPEGWRLFRAAPVGWLVLVFAYWMLMSVIALMREPGIVVALVLVPVFSVGFMAAARAADAGAPVEVTQLFEGFRARPLHQLALGALYCGALALTLVLTRLADDGALAGMMLGMRAADAEAVRSEGLPVALGIAFALYLPVMMAFWFAPVLTAWHSASPLKALFYSFFACLLNWRAFLTYGAITLTVTVILPTLLINVFALAGGGGARGPTGAFVFPLVMLLLPILYGSFYASYRDVFGAVPQQPEATS